MAERQALRVLAGAQSQQPDHWRQGDQLANQSQCQPGSHRLAANALHRSDSALGAFLRRKKAHLGAPKAITATAHKLARIIYSMLRYGQQYADAGAEYYERQYQQRALRAAKRRAAQLGYQLMPLSDALALAVPHASEVAPA